MEMANQETSAVWICDSCVHGPPSLFNGSPCAACNPDDAILNYYQKREEPVTTNADRIRAMSDEELVKVINRPCPSRFCVCGKLSAVNCEQCWLDWLRSPMKGGDDHADAAD